MEKYSTHCLDEFIPLKNNYNNTQIPYKRNSQLQINQFLKPKFKIDLTKLKLQNDENNKNSNNSLWSPKTLSEPIVLYDKEKNANVSLKPKLSKVSFTNIRLKKNKPMFVLSNNTKPLTNPKENEDLEIYKLPISKEYKDKIYQKELTPTAIKRHSNFDILLNKTSQQNKGQLLNLNSCLNVNNVPEIGMNPIKKNSLNNNNMFINISKIFSPFKSRNKGSLLKNFYTSHNLPSISNTMKTENTCEEDFYGNLLKKYKLENDKNNKYSLPNNVFTQKHKLGKDQIEFLIEKSLKKTSDNKLTYNLPIKKKFAFSDDIPDNKKKKQSLTNNVENKIKMKNFLKNEASEIPNNKNSLNDKSDDSEIPKDLNNDNINKSSSLDSKYGVIADGSNKNEIENNDLIINKYEYINKYIKNRTNEVNNNNKNSLPRNSDDRIYPKKLISSKRGKCSLKLFCCF